MPWLLNPPAFPTHPALPAPRHHHLLHLSQLKMIPLSLMKTSQAMMTSRASRAKAKVMKSRSALPVKPALLVPWPAHLAKNRAARPLPLAASQALTRRLIQTNKVHAKSARVTGRFSFTFLALSPALVSPFQGVDDQFVAFVDEVRHSHNQAGFHSGWLAAGSCGCPLNAWLGFYYLHVDS